MPINIVSFATVVCLDNEKLMCSGHVGDKQVDKPSRVVESSCLMWSSTDFFSSCASDILESEL